MEGTMAQLTKKSVTTEPKAAAKADSLKMKLEIRSGKRITKI